MQLTKTLPELDWRMTALVIYRLLGITILTLALFASGDYALVLPL